MKFFKSMFFLFLSVFLVFALSSCKKNEDEMSTMQKIQKQLNEMESYECNATLKRVSNKGENIYETKQYYKKTGEYKLELLAPETVSGNYTVFDGKTICQFNPRINGKLLIDVKDSQQRSELFLGQFIKNYMQSEGVSVDVMKLDESKCTVLEAVIPGNDKYIATEKLWVDNETLKPVQFIIYDSQGKERYVVTYNKFEYNVSFDDETFKIQQ